MNKKESYEPVSVIMPMRNSASTVLLSLKSLVKQKYPIKEITIIDNFSSDNSAELVKKYSQKISIPLKIIRQSKNLGIGHSFNTGAKVSTSKYFVFMHSDCVLKTKNELRKLTEPFRNDKSIPGTFSATILPSKIWEKYSFWEKYFFVRDVGVVKKGLTGKFDCIRADIFKKVKGYDVKNFSVGGEDADMAEKLALYGKLIYSEALAYHYHYLGYNFGFRKLLIKQRIYARAYGRLIRLRKPSLYNNGYLLFIRPALALLPFIPQVSLLGATILVIYALYFTRRMYLTKITLYNPRIILVPIVTIFFLYYDLYWMIESYIFGQNKIE